MGGADLRTSPSPHHQPPLPLQGSESPVPKLRGATTQSLSPGRRPLPKTGICTARLVSHPSGFVSTALSPKIVPGAGVGACGVGSDGLIRGSQAEDPDLSLPARAGSEGEGRAVARLHSGEAAAPGAATVWACSSHRGHTQGTGRRAVYRKPSSGGVNAETLAKLQGSNPASAHVRLWLGHLIPVSQFLHLHNRGKE